jgi:hypothetical protein
VPVSLGLVHVGPVETGPWVSQQISPAAQQAPPQQRLASPQVVVQGRVSHLPAPLHHSPSLHAVPHAPQFRGSFMRLAHLPLQQSRSASQAGLQAPPPALPPVPALPALPDVPALPALPDVPAPPDVPALPPEFPALPASPASLPPEPPPELPPEPPSESLLQPSASTAAKSARCFEVFTGPPCKFVLSFDGSPTKRKDPVASLVNCPSLMPTK